MAFILGYTNHAHLPRIESGLKSPSVALLLDIAEVLEVDVGVFFSGL